MKTVAVIGAGPAGSTAAEHLARGGHRVLLIDEKLAWEKPCGGGVTYKAYQQYPFLLSDPTPRREVVRCELSATAAKPLRFELQQPVLIYSRRDFNDMLLRRAAAAGAEVEKVRVTCARRLENSWKLETPRGSIDADFAIVATGARNPLREVGTQWTPSNTMLAMGYYIPMTSETISIRFFPWLQGYIWLFPRGDHVSAGICGKTENQRQMRQALERYLEELEIPWRTGQFYAHLIPSLEYLDWRGNRVAGENWMAVGDAAGLVDPITGEGIYYAMRSGQLAADAFCQSAETGTAAAPAYTEALQQEFIRDLELASRLSRLFYLGQTGIGTVPQRMIQFARRNRRIQQLLQDLFSGTQSYLGLRERLADSISGKVFGTIVSILRASVIPKEEATSS